MFSQTPGARAIFKRECPFCHERIVLETRRDPDNTLYLVDESIHVCRDCPFEIGDELRGFNFTAGEVHGTIVDITPSIAYTYRLDEGSMLRPDDDVYTHKKAQQHD